MEVLKILARTQPGPGFFLVTLPVPKSLLPGHNPAKPVILKEPRQKHSTKEYAELLNISPKALSKISRTHFNKTVTDLIAERIIVEAKRELYLTSKPVKSIAFELGFNDEFYFSRF